MDKLSAIYWALNRRRDPGMVAAATEAKAAGIVMIWDWRAGIQSITHDAAETLGVPIRPAPRQGPGNRSAARGHRPPDSFGNAKQVAGWRALAAEITAHLAAHPAPRSNTGNAGPHPGSLHALALAMGLESSRSTLRHMLRGTRRADSDGARIPGPEKIKAARSWLKMARREARR